MTDATKYNPTVAWHTIVSNVFQLTRETTDNPATYRVTVKSTNPNDIGRGQVDEECYLTDYLGIPYTVIATGTGTIDVEDSFRTKYCPTNNKMGIIHKSAYKGYSLYLPSSSFVGLHKIAQSNNNKYAMSILWRNDPNARRVLFENTDTPELRPFDHDYTDIDGVVFNPSEDYDKPKVRLLLVDSEGNIVERSERSYFEITTGEIVAVTFGQLDEITDWIIEISN